MRKYNKEYQSRSVRKRGRSKARLSRVQEGVKKEMADKAIGLTYSSGMNIEGDCGEEGGRKG